MSITRNRELSQFGSFIYVDNNSQEIGITTEATPYVGIGTTNPQYKFHVVGNANIDGDLTITAGKIESTSYFLNGAPLVDASLSQWTYASNGIDLYQDIANVAIGTSTFTQKLTVRGNVSAGQFISTVTSGTAPLVVLSDTQVTNLNASFLRGKVPPTGDIVGTGDIQTLTNKTLTSPTINSPNITSLNVSSGGLNVVGGIGVTGGITFRGTISGGTVIQSAANALGTLTLPATNDTLVGRATTDTFTNKTIAASSNTITGLTNANLSGSAGIVNANLANSTISGVSLGSTLPNLTFGSYLTSTGSYNGSVTRTVSIAGTSVNTPNTVVVRDISGNFDAGTVTASVFNATSGDSYRVSGTTVIDGSRNLINVNSYAISATTVIDSSRNLTNVNSYAVSGTTVIDSSRNLRNINSFSSTVTSAWSSITVTAVGKTLTNRENCTVTASGQTINLPPSPSPGWEVLIGVGNFVDTIVGRNGQNIMGLAEDLTINSRNVSINLIFIDATRGWRIV